MDTKQLESQLGEILTQIKESKAAAVAQEQKYGTMLSETKTQLEALQKQADAIDSKLAERSAAGKPEATFEEELKENSRVQNFVRKETNKATFELNAKQVRQLFERKTTITSDAVGRMTTGVLQIDRIGGIVEEARETLTVRNLLTARPTTMQVIDFVKVNSPLVSASPQVEASAKLENAVTFTTDSERVRTLATWIPATKQILDDFSELMGFLMSSLPYYVNLEEETQLLSGSGLQEDLNGLITQATAFDTNLLSGVLGWTKLDIVGRVINQITTAKEVQPSFIVLHPNDWWDIRLTKDGDGRYIFPLNGPVDLFGLRAVVTTNIAADTFLVGSGSPIASEIRDREGMTVELSREHSDYFTKNMVAIRAEKRLALVVKRPASYITGTFTTSP